MSTDHSHPRPTTDRPTEPPGTGRDAAEPSPLDSVLVRAGLDRELRLLDEAILLVAGGRSARVTVAGLRFAEEAIAVLAPIATARGARLTPIWTTDEQGADIRVERVGDDPR